MYRITVEGGVRCAVQDPNPRGGRTIVFVHGWPHNHKIFESQFHVLPQYGIRCVGVDLRGFGASDKPSRGYGYNRLADDLQRVIASLDCRSVALCGFSMGGAVCVRYMARHNAFKVHKLILMGAACPSFVQRPGYPYGMTTQQVDSIIAGAYSNRPKLCASFGRMCFAQDPGEEFVSWLTGIGLEAAGTATIQCAEALRDEDLRGDLSRIGCPTAIFHGVHDKVCPFPFADEMRKGIKDSFTVPFEQSGHCLFYEERDKCNGSLIDFINGP